MHAFLAANAPWRALVENRNVDPRPNDDVDLGDGVRVTAFQVPHRNEYADTVGYRIDGPRASALFIPDIDRWVSGGDAVAGTNGSGSDFEQGVAARGGDGSPAEVVRTPWEKDVRALVSSVDYAFLDGTFLSGDELPGRDMSKVPHPLVTDTMDRLDGLGAKVWFIHLNHTNPLLDDPSPVE